MCNVLDRSVKFWQRPLNNNDSKCYEVFISFHNNNDRELHIEYREIINQIRGSNKSKKLNENFQLFDP